jgi:hypothetical protein
MSDKSFREIREEKEQEAKELARQIRDALREYAATLPHVKSVTSQNFGSAFQFSAYAADNTLLCKGSVKVSQNWKGGPHNFVAYATVAGGWAGRSNSDGRSQVYRVASLEKLDGPKSKLAKGAEAAWRYERDSEAADRDRKALGRANTAIFKAAGYRVATASGHDIEDEMDDAYDWMFGTEIVGEKDGLRIGLKANGELMVRLPDTMRLEDFLKKLG